MVEIAKAISNEARVIIMDEPTSSLTEREVATLFRIIRELTQKGVAIIYISHKMEEIFAIADTITVLRDGQYIVTKPASEFNTDSLITLMVGRQISSLFPPSPLPPAVRYCRYSTSRAMANFPTSVSLFTRAKCWALPA